MQAGVPAVSSEAAAKDLSEGGITYESDGGIC